MKIGQLVICIKSFDSCGFETLPQEGKVYTVRTFELSKGRGFIRLEEIINMPRMYYGDVFGEARFASTAFREIEFNSESISELMEMEAVNA